MNRTMKRLASFLLVAVLTFSCSTALACTGYYVGKDASASGHTIIGHTSTRGTPLRPSRSSIRTSRRAVAH